MNIALIGYGKMGRAIEEIALEKGHQILLKIDLDNQFDLTVKNLKLVDVAIEFTGPDSAVNNIMKCFEAQIPVVCGSTGWLKHEEEVKKACLDQDATILYSSNFSIGVNIFFELNKKLAAVMNKHPEYNILLEETHHTQKKDAPSGTAITLAEGIINNIASKKSWVNEPATNNSAVPIISYRIDPAPGTHSVKYTSPVDDIQIMHTAHNRTGFASGAVLAAEYIANKKGIFSMNQVLGL